jgi:hypothetical protein
MFSLFLSLSLPLSLSLSYTSSDIKTYKILSNNE